MSRLPWLNVGGWGFRRGPFGVLAAVVAIVLLGSGPPAHASLNITATFDVSITSDPAAVAIEGAINAAIAIYNTTYSNPITVPIYFQEGGGLGGSQTVLYNLGYANFRAGLAANQALSGQLDQATALLNLPNTTNNPVTSSPNLFVKTADIKALGFGAALPPNPGVGPGGNFDGVITLNTSLTNPGSPGSSLQYFLAPVVKHEIDEVLGLGSALPNPPFGVPFAEDLYRYGAPGSRSFTATNGTLAYFSINGGVTNLAQFHNTNDGADYGDWQNNATPRVQDAFGTPGANPALGVELTVLDALGYTRSQQPEVVPEPSNMLLAALGILGLSSYGWRRSKQRVEQTVA